MFKKAIKSAARTLALAFAFPVALLAGFGRLPAVFEFFAQLLALAPGLPGSYLRVAYYAMTLRKCSLESYIGMGSFFAHREAWLGRRTYIGAMCILGRVRIGDGTMIASGVQIPSGARQHIRDQQGEMTDAGGRYDEISVGAHCWVGAGAIVMADLGEKATIAAGAVVVKPVEPGAVMGGIPARSIASAT